MPDLGDLRRGRRRRGREDEGATEEPAGDSDVTEFADLLRTQLERRRPPAGSITEPWAFGIGSVFAAHPQVPDRLRGTIRRLDRFGGIEITPERIAFDRDDVEWTDVTEIHTRHVADYLLGDAVQQRLRSVPLPPFPGRRRLMDALGRAVLTVVIAATGEGLQALDLLIPAEVEYRGRFGRRKTLSAGPFGALALADPAVKECVVASAEARGVLVKPSEEDGYADAAKRAAAIRERVGALQAELDRLTRFGRSKPDSPDE